MRRIITLASLSLALTGGVAAASPRYENRNVERREHVDGRRDVRERRYFDRDRRPEGRFERFEHRSGSRWVAGEWRWNGYEWIWSPGHYVRAWR